MGTENGLNGWKPLLQLGAACAFLATGGGISHNALGSKLDRQGEVLERIATSVTEVRVQVSNGEKVAAENAAQISAQGSRVLELEKAYAAQNERLNELVRRLNLIDRK